MYFKYQSKSIDYIMLHWSPKGPEIWFSDYQLLIINFI